MKESIPASVNVISWIVIVLSSFAILSGLGYIFVSVGASLKGPTLQIVLAASMILSSYYLRKGSNRARIGLSIQLGVVIAAFIGSAISSEFFGSTQSYLGLMTVVVPMTILIFKLQSLKVKRFVAGNET